MKKYFFVLLCCTLLKATNISAQCNFVSPTVELNFISTAVPGFCDINFNLTFDVDQNNGSKYTFIHLWRTSDYQIWVTNPSYNAYTTTQNTQPEFNNPGGDALNILQNAVATIIINNTTPPATFETFYGVDGDAPVKSNLNTPGMTITIQTLNATTLRYVLSNVVVRVPTPPGPNGCNSAISFTGDAWSSQANNANPVLHCAMLGDDFTFTINDVGVTGFKNCTLPLKYTIGLTTTETTPFDVYYDVYVDNGDNIFNSATDHIVVNNSGPHSISSVQGYSGGSLPFDDPNSVYAGIDYKNNSLWYVITAPTVFSNLVLYTADNSCATLPVVLSNFSARRNGNYVNLLWQTESEINSLGFAIERKNENGWQQVGFVPSLANGGNSDQQLNYQFSEINTARGVSYYRLQQQDINGESKYSEVRIVRAEHQNSKIIIYPNPSSDGSVNIVFEEKEVLRNIIIADMAGRNIRYMKGVRNNNITINGLSPGVYSIRILDLETGEQSIRKLVVGRQ